MTAVTRDLRDVLATFRTRCGQAEKPAQSEAEGLALNASYLVSRLLGSAASLRGALVRGSLGSFGIKIVYTLLGLATSIVLARALSPEGYGIYAFAFSVMSLLAVPVQMGLPMLVMREVARYQHAGRWDLLRGILKRANQAVLLVSMIFGLMGAVVVWWLADRVDATQLATVGWALLLLPLVGLNKLRGAALRGLRRVVLGQLPEMLLQPGILLVLLGIALLAGDVTPPQSMAFYCASAGLAFLAGALMLLRSLPPEVLNAQPQYNSCTWMRSVLPLSLLAGLQVINGQTALLILGLLASDEEVGLYRVALSLGALVVFALTAVNTVIAPHIARLHSAGDRKRLQRMITLSSRITLLAALPMAGVLIIFGEAILNLAFGEAYQDASVTLAIICFGQIVNAGMGSVSLILNMTGYERETVKGLAIAAGANVLLNAALIPSYGGEGAAMASAVCLIVWNLSLCRAVWKRLELQSTAIRFPCM